MYIGRVAGALWRPRAADHQRRFASAQNTRVSLS
jgi:hypothetical protein